jgi:hypothetical protein
MPVALGVAIVAVVAGLALLPLRKGSPGRSGYECEFDQVNKGAVTCVDGTQWLRAERPNRPSCG